MGPQSRFYRSAAFPFGSGPDFVNGVILVSSNLSQRHILNRLHLVESSFLRSRTGRWKPRTLDLDLLYIGQTVAPNAEIQSGWRNLPPERQRHEAPDTLILPHPRLQDRAFVLVPLAEVAPDWRHPLVGLTVAQMRDRLPAEELAALEVLD